MFAALYGLRGARPGSAIPHSRDDASQGEHVNKLRLDLNELQIESFRTAPARERETAANDITQNHQTCYDCTRFGCPGTELC
jgi:hypothetical protein